ncbi:intermembrane space import and assembly protein 40 [Flagelloscypha sp. PMI_526]|nr:intermembrane space import and assembly protein 40 [Flagelloscypha sp. PMI_526]
MFARLRPSHLLQKRLVHTNTLSFRHSPRYAGLSLAVFAAAGLASYATLNKTIHLDSSGSSPSLSDAPTPSPEGTPESGSSGQAAFNPETGEINWDCPCLGGMAEGPCGEKFKAAFSCFVFSEAEPKGINCVDHFRAMQECFREHPDIYGEDEEVAGAEEPTTATDEAAVPASTTTATEANPPAEAPLPTSHPESGTEKQTAPAH